MINMTEFWKGDLCKVCSWKTRPTLIDYWPTDIDKIIAIDENGITHLRRFIKLFQNYEIDLIKASKDKTLYKDERWFTVTGVVIQREYFPAFKKLINEIKFKHWENGIYQYNSGKRRVVLHSREIRREEGPFNPKLINYSELIQDISYLIESTNFSIYSSSIDKIKHIHKYKYPMHVYNLSLNFVIERFCLELNRNNENGIILLESRGKKEDRNILKFIVNLLEHGNNFNTSNHFSRIKGVYFNPKWCFQKHNGKASFVLLELADLVSYPIYKFAKTGEKDKAFLRLENKIDNYPNYFGFGIKMFP